MPQTLCPCDRGLPFPDCCGPYLDGTKLPPRAIELMRSRYSAYVLRRADYLKETWHPTSRPADLDLEGDETLWTGLEILATEEGNPGDKVGQVEFRARFCVGDQKGALHETSFFVHDGDRWLYVQGDIHPAPGARAEKPSRNAPCPCGSGKKYKRCCAD